MGFHLVKYMGKLINTGMKPLKVVDYYFQNFKDTNQSILTFYWYDLELKGPTQDQENEHFLLG